MIWDNSIFDRAFDAVGLRQRVKRVSDGVEFSAQFNRPQAFVLDGMSHTTDYEIEHTTADVTPPIQYHDLLEVEVSHGKWERYRVKQEPLIQGDGYWTRVQLERMP